jgi:hypothetical protein
MSLPNRNVRKVFAAMSVEELATKHVLITSDVKIPSRIYSAQDLLDELDRRVGPVMLQVKLQEARETLAMVGLETWNGRPISG